MARPRKAIDPNATRLEAAKADLRQCVTAVLRKPTTHNINAVFAGMMEYQVATLEEFQDPDADSRELPSGS
jgi:hypothetical protein